VAVGRDGAVLVAGAFNGELELGRTALNGGGFGGLNPFAGPYERVFLARIDACGDLEWGNAFGPTERLVAAYVTGAPTDDQSVVAASYGGSGDPASAVVAKLDPQGNAIWMRSFSATDRVILFKPTLNADGGVIVAGNFVGDLSFEGGPVISVATGAGLASKLDSSGALAWITVVPWLTGGAADAEGNVVLHADVAPGTYVDFGGGPMKAPGSEHSGVLAKLDASGTHVWSELIGSVVPTRMALTPDGDIVTVDINTATWVDRFDSAGLLLAQRKFTGLANLFPSLSAGDGRGLLMAAYGRNPVDFGTGLVLGEGQSGLVIGRLDEDLEPIDARSFLTTFQDRPDAWDEVLIEGQPAIVPYPGGGVVVAGRYTEGIDFGQGLLDGVNLNDVFVARLKEAP
jgi:hypothetical protein